MIHLPHHPSDRGGLTWAQFGDHIPFEIKRAYWIFDTPEGAERGGHAHKTLRQAIFALRGSFDLDLISLPGIVKTFHLDDPSVGVLIEPGTWRDLRNFTECAVCLVLASDVYDEDDYIRDFDEFMGR